MSTTPDTVTASLTQDGGRIIIEVDGTVAREIANTTRETAGTWLAVYADVSTGTVCIAAEDIDRGSVEEQVAEVRSFARWAVAVQLQAHGTPAPGPAPKVTAERLPDSNWLAIRVLGEGEFTRTAGLAQPGRWIAVVKLDSGYLGVGCVHRDREVVDRYVASAAGMNAEWAAACLVS